MIRDGCITHPGAIPSIWNYTPPSVISITACAILTTLLSYQLTAIFHDILLGCKRRGCSQLSSIAAVLVIHDGSFWTRLAAVTQHPLLLRLRFHGWGSHCAEGKVRRMRPTSTILWMALLVVIAPVINLGAVFITVESNNELTFGDVGVGGLALGIANQRSIGPENFAVCGEVKVMLQSCEMPRAVFLVCNEASVDEQKEGYGGAPKLTMDVKNSKIIFKVTTPEVDAMLVIELRIVSGGNVYIPLVKLRDEDRMRLFQMAVDWAHRYCDPKLPVEPATHQENSTGLRLHTMINCAMAKMRPDQLFDDVRDLVGFVESQDTSVELIDLHQTFEDFLPHRIDPTISIVDLQTVPFLMRTEAVQFSWLCISALVAVVARVVVKLTTNNDVDRVTETLFKERTEGFAWDSVLQSRRWIQWKNDVKITWTKEMCSEEDFWSFDISSRESETSEFENKYTSPKRAYKVVDRELFFS